MGRTNNNLHMEKMARKKTARNRMMEKKHDKKGLLIVHTGTGKGKSSAAFGMVLRCVGHNMKVGVVQFIKGAWDTAERRLFGEMNGLVTFCSMGEGFTWETQDRDRDLAAAACAWKVACEMIADTKMRMIVLDELNVALRYGLLSLDEILNVVAKRSKETHVVITGRNAPEGLIKAADLVTEMKAVKHPFRHGIKAQPGVEF